MAKRLALGFKRRIAGIVKVFCAAFTALSLIIMYTPASNILARPLVVEEPGLKKADIIVVLGGGAYPNGALGGSSNERLIRGMRLYRAGYSKRVIFAGGTIVEPARKLFHTVTGSNDSSAIGVVEASIMNDIAVELIIPAADSAIDADSTNTRENLVHLRSYMDRYGLKSCILVTSATHMRRASLAARKLGLNCMEAPVMDYSAYRTGAIDRIALLREVMWEYAGLLLYKVKGYI